jgi:hypothetical protein
LYNLCSKCARVNGFDTRFFSLFSGTVFVLSCLLVLLHFGMSWIHVPDYFQEIKWSCHVYIMLSYIQICCDLNLFCSIKKVRMLLSSTLHINLIHNTFVCTILYYSLRPMKFILTLSEYGWGSTWIYNIFLALEIICFVPRVSNAN